MKKTTCPELTRLWGAKQGFFVAVNPGEVRKVGIIVKGEEAGVRWLFTKRSKRNHGSRVTSLRLINFLSVEMRISPLTHRIIESMVGE